MEISLLFGFIFLVGVQPLLLVIMLMGIVLLYALEMYFMSLSFWYGYILMLVLLSGVLVIFTYVISLTPNESFEYMSLLMIFLSFFLFFLSQAYMIFESQGVGSIVLWEGIMGGYMIYLAILLLSIMVMVIFVSFPFEGALRLFFSAWLKG